ncbi:MAG TPA: TadE family protein [Candidatus Sulfotelmatobacter sp.]
MSNIFRTVQTIGRLSAAEDAAQIVEFAVSLPLLIVFVVGIFDFSGAFTLKQKLANAAREGARTAAADPATDLGNNGLSCTSLVACPASVSDAYQVMINYIDEEKINDCGLKPGPSTVTQSGLTWTFSANSSGPPPCKISLAINRGLIIKQPVAGGNVNIVGTEVDLQYDYKWQFNTVITLLVPGAKYKGTTTLKTSAIAFNEN